MERPLVSVVTPFYNTAAWLPDCIESVLAQTYDNWEYVLLDNCSTDGSAEIAQEYAARDPRIRYVKNASLLPQVPNYNAALALISNESRYCKMVQADDWIFPDCLASMVAVFEESPSVGLVSGFHLKGAKVLGAGLTYPNRRVPGKDVVRLLLRSSVYLFGSPSVHMYRSSIVRGRRPFYDETRTHDDTEACVQILEEWDFGFVHQVCAFLRTQEGSITSRARGFEPLYLDHYILVRRYASVFLEPLEAADLQRRVRRFYYSFLARSLMLKQPPGFWQYHREGLRTLGEEIERPVLLSHLARRLGWLAINPGRALSLALGRGSAANEPTRPA